MTLVLRILRAPHNEICIFWCTKKKEVRLGLYWQHHDNLASYSIKGSGVYSTVGFFKLLSQEIVVLRLFTFLGNLFCSKVMLELL